MRIPTLLQKIAELSEHPERCTAIDIDLMLDYTRMLYADLLEWRSKLPATLQPTHMPVIREPTLDELANAMKQPEQKMPSVRHTQALKSPPPAADISNVASAQMPEANAKDIRALIGINDKYQIMSELFGNDKAAYEDALTHINSAASADAAIAWLRDRLWIAEEHGDVAQQFFDIVRRAKV